MSPVFRRLAEHRQIDLQVAYCCLRGANSGYDPEFATAIQWDVPLLEGYDWAESTGAESFMGLCNPFLWQLIRRNDFDAVLCQTGYLKASFWIAFLAARLSGSVFLFRTDANSLAPRDSQSWEVTLKRVLWPRPFSLADHRAFFKDPGSHEVTRPR